MNIIQLLYMDDIYKRINNLYNTKGYMDRYGMDVWIVVIVCIVFLLAVCYFQVMNKVEPIKADWANQKCNPAVIPFAGMINNTSSSETNLEFTASNFSGCINSILTTIVGYAFQPFYYLMNLITTEFNNLLNAVNSIRGEFDSIRNSVSGVTDEIMGKALNVTMPIVQTTIVGKDVGTKAVGTIAATIYSFFGGILGVESTFSIIMKAMWEAIWILVGAIPVLLAIAAALYAAGVAFPPALIGAGIASAAALADIVILIAASIMYSLLQIVATDSFHMATPSASKYSGSCFSENTIVKLKKGKKKFSSLRPGDVLHDGSKVTSIMKLSSYGQQIYNLDNIIVTGNHNIFHEDLGWIPVEKHPRACSIEDFREPFIYCINTDTKTIKIGNYTFADWDDLDDEDLTELTGICSPLTPLPKNFTKKDIHTYLDSGFQEDTKIELDDGNSVSIKNIEVNDTLRFGERIIGIVKIDANKLIGVCEYHLEDHISIKCTGNILIIDSNLGNTNTFNMEGTKLSKEKYVYHLLTDTGNFIIKGKRFGDYNTGIEKYLSGYGHEYSSFS